MYISDLIIMHRRILTAGLSISASFDIVGGT